jgi:hypothetical protein
MSRYEINQRIMDKGWVIWDTTLQKFIGNGKGEVLTLPTMGQTLKVVADLRERVAA